VHKTLRGPRSAIIFSRRDVTLPNAKGEQKSISDLIDRAVFPGMQGGPHVNQIAAVAVALREAASPEFKKYAKQVIKNAQVLAEELKKKGWRIVSDGTDSHLLLVDTWMNGLGVSGAVASDLLEKAGVIVNKNTIPGETRSPMDPSGIRIGTPGETTRGRTEKDMIKIADLIDKTLRKKSKKKK
nr:aminotransferase class I/II-fold pyridoxal phosphate-dependent enzyme [bacterium]